ncbi:MAG: holdfast anchoring protein HfaA [Alphaproteobacteria bacterium]|nr:holdfast anchoring protein HfaA [Alphaproteobacteria bacterium]MDE1986558.1 holdfast anchoring protein HfaA [Alphaproteobacteria bacterium]MDE2164170.1 holdfast anchoring protein HfaA [Alphaproteobacteria bacterium]MDE2500254.1 holdfast anchoring protein HfaA [Alphaproteobacteria bacterium]
MPFDIKQLLFASLTLLGAIALGQVSHAADYSSAASYNSPYGLSAGAENQTINPSLRDANGNLSVVNGQFTSSAFSQQTGVQSMGTISSSALASLGNGGSGVGAGGTAYGSATAIGNSLNVVTVGSNNTVIVNSSQTNNGNQNASVSLNGH